MTHAFFKALLFLGAGSVIHALSGEQDLRKMGGLAQEDSDHLRRPCSAPASPSPAFRLSRASIVRMRFSPRPIEHAPWMYWVGVFTAGMTAFYVFRALFLCFFGEYRRAIQHHPPRIAAGHVDSAGDSRRAEPGRRIHQHSEIPGADVRRAAEGEAWTHVRLDRHGTRRHRAGRICSTWSRRRFPKAWRKVFSGAYRWMLQQVLRRRILRRHRGRTRRSTARATCCGAWSMSA